MFDVSKLEKGVFVFSKTVCANCITVKNKLWSQGVEYGEIRVDDNQDALAFLKDSGYRSVPVVFKDGKEWNV